MKKILIILFLLFPSVAFGKWIKLSYNSLTSVYFDESTVKILSGQTIEYVELIDFKKPMVSIRKGISIFSTINIKVVDCGTNQSEKLLNTPSKHKYLRINSFSKNMGKGDFVGTEKGDNKWIDHQKGSVDYKVSKGLCNAFLIKKLKQSGDKTNSQEEFVKIVSGENEELFYDINSVKLISNSSIEYVELTNQNKLNVHFKTGKLMSSMKSIKILNCSPIKHKYVKHEYYSGKNGKGDLIDSENLNQKWSILTENYKLNKSKKIQERVDSLLKVHNYLCSKYRS